MATMIKNKETGEWRYVNRDLAFAPFEYSSVRRGLQFDPAVRNGIIAKKGWAFTCKDTDNVYRHYQFTKDTAFSMGTLAPGRSYRIKAVLDGNELSLVPEACVIGGDTEHWGENIIGAFSTLCVSVPAGETSRKWGTPAAGSTVLVHPSAEVWGEAFKNLYTKTVISQTADYYIHEKVLAGFNAGDILPESVQCTTFRSNSKYIDAQVFEPAAGLFWDVYLASGIQDNMRSVFGAVHTVSRTYAKMEKDLATVGKFPPNSVEFEMAANGSPCNTEIQGAKDWSTVGGHVANRTGAGVAGRLISDIGCEEMCGYLWQILRDQAGYREEGWTNVGHANFGYDYGDAWKGSAGGNWRASTYCGPSCRSWNDYRSDSGISDGYRGASLLSPAA